MSKSNKINWPNYKLEIPTISPELMTLIEESFDELEKAMPNIEILLEKYDWFMTPSFAPNFLYQFIPLTESKEKDESLREKMDNIFISHFSAHNWYCLDDMVEMWQRDDLFQGRIEIIKDCTQVIKVLNNQINVANVVIPTLLTQLEGVIVDYLTKCVKLPISEISTYNKKKVNFITHYETLTSKRFKFKAGGFSATETIRKNNDLALKILINLVYQDFKYDKSLKTPFSLNRHRILHGEYYNYGNIPDMIRIFLFFDFIHYLKWNYEKVKSY